MFSLFLISGDTPVTTNNILSSILFAIVQILVLFGPIIVWFFIAHLIAKKVDNEQIKIIILALFNMPYTIYYVLKYHSKK